MLFRSKSFEVGRSLAVVAGMKKPNDHAEPTKVEHLFFYFFKLDLYGKHPIPLVRVIEKVGFIGPVWQEQSS